MLIIYLILISSFGLSSAQNFCDCGNQGYHFDIDTQKCEKLESSDNRYIQNCFQHYKDPQTKSISCQICEQTHYKKFGECRPHNIPGCIQARENGFTLECEKCSDNYWFDSKNYNCKEKTSDTFANCDPKNLFFNDSLRCGKCQQNYYWKENQCLSNPTEISEGKIDNCQDYLQWERLECQKCEDNYYYNNKANKCVSFNDNTDEYHVEQCKEYGVLTGVPNKPKCDECNNGFMILIDTNSQLTECVQVPQNGQEGFDENCQYYMYDYQLGKKICDVCQEGYYKKEDDKCYLIQESDRISFCGQYNYDQNSDRYSCSKCKDNYFSVDGFQNCMSCPIIVIENPEEQPVDPEQTSNIDIIKFQIGVLSILFSIFI